MNYPSVMVTGHRSIYQGSETWVKENFVKVALQLKKHHGLEEMISGMALGVDTLWARIALKLKVPLASYVPFEVQANTWPAADRELWLKLRAAAQREEVIGDHYHVKFFHERNYAMLRDADLVVAVLDSNADKGGTFAAVKRARELERPLIWLDAVTQTIKTEHMED